MPSGPRGLAAPGQRLRPRLCREIGEPSHRDPAGRQNRREPAPAAPSGPPGRGRRRRRRAEEKPFLPCGAGEASRIDPIDPLSPPRKPRGWSPAPRVCSPRLHRSGGTGQRAGEGPPGRRGRGAGSRGRRGPPGPSWAPRPRPCRRSARPRGNVPAGSVFAAAGGQRPQSVSDLGASGRLSARARRAEFSGGSGQLHPEPRPPARPAARCRAPYRQPKPWVHRAGMRLQVLPCRAPPRVSELPRLRRAGHGPPVAAFSPRLPLAFPAC